MQKSCKNEGCQRKFDKTCHSDYCPPCSNAFRSGETQTNKRADHQQRQQTARAQAQLVNRNITSSQSNPAPPPTYMTQTTAAGIMYPGFHPPPGPPIPSSQPNLTPDFGQPRPQTTQTHLPTPPPQSAPANNNINFPQIDQPRPLPSIDVNRLFDTFTSMEAGTESVNPERAMRDMYGMMLHMFSQTSENENVKSTVKVCVTRLDALEAKVGDPDEVAIPLSIAVRNMPLPSHGATDLQLVQSAFREIKAQGVDVERDIVKANRIGDTSNGRLGTILVEMRTQEAKVQIMKKKSDLETHPNEGLRKLFIKKAQTKNEIKTNVALNEMLKRIPGQENNFVAGNGHIMSRTPRQNFPNQRQQFNPPNPNQGNPAPRQLNPNTQYPFFNQPPPGFTPYVPQASYVPQAPYVPPASYAQQTPHIPPSLIDLQAPLLPPTPQPDPFSQAMDQQSDITEQHQSQSQQQEHTESSQAVNEDPLEGGSAGTPA